MKEFNLDRLENADDETIRRMSDNFRAVSDKKISEMYIRAEKMYNERKENAADSAEIQTVKIVEYRSSVRKKIIAAASAFIVIAGGFVLFNKSSDRNTYISTEIISENNSDDEELNEKEYLSPFGDFSKWKIRCTDPAYVPYLLVAEPETVKNLSEIFNSSEWKEVSSNNAWDGERATMWLNDGENCYELTVCPNNFIDVTTGEKTVHYIVSEDITAAARKAAYPDDIHGKLIWSSPENLTEEGVWINNETVPDEIFEPYEPEEMKDKIIKTDEPIYEFDYNPSEIESIGELSDNIVIGRVDSISCPSRGLSEDGRSAVTQISVTVSSDTEGVFTEGDKVNLYMLGGYISLRESLGELLYKSDEEKDNTFIHEIVWSGEVPFTGKEYAFYISEYNGEYSIPGGEYGILYKCDNTYIRRNYNSFEFYDIDDLRSYLISREEAETLGKIKQLYPEFFENKNSPSVEIYVWKMTEDIYMCGLTPVTNRNKTDEELMKLQGKALTLDECRLFLKARRVKTGNFAVFPIKQPYSSYFGEIDDDDFENILGHLTK